MKFEDLAQGYRDRVQMYLRELKAGNLPANIARRNVRNILRQAGMEHVEAHLEAMRLVNETFIKVS